MDIEMDLMDLFDEPVECPRPFKNIGHRCEVGGGDASCSLDGRHWYCHLHVPAGFWPKIGD
jgi:hypothetical protein